MKIGQLELKLSWYNKSVTDRQTDRRCRSDSLVSLNGPKHKI